MTSLAAANRDFKKGDKVMALVSGGGYAGMCAMFLISCNISSIDGSKAF